MLIKKICFFGAIFLATPLLMAQYKLSGTIKDSDNKEPLKNASIYFTDLKKNTTTDQNGSYFFENLKEGKYFVEISHSNYSTFLATIDVKNDTIAMLFKFICSSCESVNRTLPYVIPSTLSCEYVSIS